MAQTYEALVAYIEALIGVTSDFPFGFDTKVFRIGGKIFVLMAWDEDPVTISLKGDPEESIILRQTYASVIPGYHLNKRHWNTIICNNSLPDAELYHLIDKSYSLVFAGLPREVKAKLLQGS